MSNSQLLKKLSPKQLIGDIKGTVKAESVEGGKLANNLDQMSAYRIFGIASGVITGTTDYGAWVAFTGTHEAVDSNGQIFKSNKAFLPAPVDAMLEQALSENDDVQYALEVFVKRRDDLAIGYEFVPAMIVETQENDPLAALRNQTLAIVDQSGDTETAQEKAKPKAKK